MEAQEALYGLVHIQMPHQGGHWCPSQSRAKHLKPNHRGDARAGVQGPENLEF